MKKLIEQKEIDDLCDELNAFLAFVNEYGGSGQSEVAFAELKQKIAEIGDRLLCPCRG